MEKPNQEVLWTLKKKDSGKVYPHLPFSRLKAWILEARVDPQDSLINPDLKTWVEAGSIPELARFFAPETMGSDVLSSDEIVLPWRSETEEEVEFDITPMIDTTFLLLTFFIATATFAIHQVKNITVPKAYHAQEYKQEKIAITVDKERRIYLGREEVGLDRLKQRVGEEVNKTRQQDIVVSADHTLEYGFIISVLDEINDAGLENIKLKVEKKKK